LKKIIINPSAQKKTARGWIAPRARRAKTWVSAEVPPPSTGGGSRTRGGQIHPFQLSQTAKGSGGGGLTCAREKGETGGRMRRQWRRRRGSSLVRCRPGEEGGSKRAEAGGGAASSTGRERGTGQGGGARGGRRYMRANLPDSEGCFGKASLSVGTWSQQRQRQGSVASGTPGRLV
jgi:hypothetical protein